jgi:hypothetical protein
MLSTVIGGFSTVQCHKSILLDMRIGFDISVYLRCWTAVRTKRPGLKRPGQWRLDSSGALGSIQPVADSKNLAAQAVVLLDLFTDLVRPVQDGRVVAATHRRANLWK